MKNKKFIIALGIELLFTFILIAGLFYIRDQTKSVIAEMQDGYADLKNLEETLGKESLTSYDQQEVQSKLDSFEKLENPPPEAQEEIKHWFLPSELMDYRTITEAILYDVNLDSILE